MCGEGEGGGGGGGGVVWTERKMYTRVKKIRNAVAFTETSTKAYVLGVNLSCNNKHAQLQTGKSTSQLIKTISLSIPPLSLTHTHTMYNQFSTHIQYTHILYNADLKQGILH